MSNLSKEELELLESVENGEWKSIDNLESELLRYKYNAKQHFKNSKANIYMTEKSTFKIQTNISQGMDFWKNNANLSESKKQEIKDLNVLFVPQEQNGKGLFTDGAEALYNYLSDTGDKSIKSGFCVDDDKYKKLGLYSDPLTLTVIGTIVISSVIAPIMAELILDFIRGIRDKDNQKNLQTKVSINIIVDHQDGDRKEIQIVGTPDDIEKVLPKCFLELPRLSAEEEDSRIYDVE